MLVQVSKNRSSRKSVQLGVINLGGDLPRPAPARSRFYVRHILPSDEHPFVGRIFQLGIVGYHFDSYEALSAHVDCKYAFDVNEEVSILARRVESLNLVGDMFWPSPMPQDFAQFPMSRYEWLTVAADVFLMRYVSVVDCAMLVINQVFEAELAAPKCSISNLKKAGIPSEVVDLLEAMQAAQGSLRAERNRRFHHGAERGFTQDDLIFKSAALMEHRGGVSGTDSFGRPLNLNRSFKEGLVELQKEFNAATRKLVRQLNALYDMLEPEFESRFSPRFRVGPFGSARRA